MKGYRRHRLPALRISQSEYPCNSADFSLLHTHRTIAAAVKAIEATNDARVPEVRELLQFISGARRGIQPSVRSIRAMMYDPDHD